MNECTNPPLCYELTRGPEVCGCFLNTVLSCRRSPILPCAPSGRGLRFHCGGRSWVKLAPVRWVSVWAPCAGVPAVMGSLRAVAVVILRFSSYIQLPNPCRRWKCLVWKTSTASSLRPGTSWQGAGSVRRCASRW